MNRLRSLLGTIDWLEHEAFAGRIGMTHCPGASTGPSGLADDIAAIRAQGATALITLSEAEELRFAGLTHLEQAARRRRLAWHHLPIRDFGVPGPDFEARWRTAWPELRARLEHGESIVMHCWAGLGRTGTIAARMLVEFGEAPAVAIRLVRHARPGAVQTDEQEAYVLALRPPGHAA